MQTNDALEAMIPVVAALRRLGVKYYICGSLASTFYGIARTTTDVDLVAELSQSDVSAFAEAIREQYYVDEKMILDAISQKSCFKLVHLPTASMVIVYSSKDRPYDKMAMERTQENSLDDELPEARFFLPSPEDVVLSKLEWYRLGDEVSERQWRDIAGVMKVNRASLDRKYMEQWAVELGVADLLAKAWKEVEADGP
ncbi:MAG: hypothetical protein KKE86_02940 [Planctomycetes bacterium]|nr:hypothetical protein [Planctomycetota bacterium]